MGMPQAARRYTVDEVLAFPSDGNRYELVHGELLVTPAPQMRHQLTLSRLWHPDDEQPEIVTDALRWRVGAEAEELEIDPAKFFAAP